MQNLDHLVYGVPDLPKGVKELEELLGVKATPGGRHPNKGTHNALIALSTESYIEIIAPDPAQAPFKNPMWFELEKLTSPKLLNYAIKASDITIQLQKARAAGISIGEIENGSRAKPDGSLLSWQLTNPANLFDGGLIPFLINWGNSLHPAGSVSANCRLISLEAFHPEPELIAGKLTSLGVEMKIRKGIETELIATIDSPNGVVVLK